MENRSVVDRDWGITKRSNTIENEFPQMMKRDQDDIINRGAEHGG